MRAFFGFLLAVLMVACTPEATPIVTSTTTSFFDLKSYFEQEIASLDSQVLALAKKSIINESIEVQQVDTFDLEKELSIFIASDINRPTWLDQYQVDSTWEQSSLSSVAYTALNDNLKTKKLVVDFDTNQSVKEIVITKGIENMAVQSEQLLRYTTGKGYVIQNKQSLVFSEPKQVAIEVGFVLKK